MLDVSYIYIVLYIYIYLLYCIYQIYCIIYCVVYIYIYIVYNIYIYIYIYIYCMLYIVYIYIYQVYCAISRIYIYIYILRSVYGVPFEKLALPIGGSPNRKKWPERGSVTSVRANILTLGRTDNFPAMCDGPGPQFLDFKVVFNVFRPNNKIFFGANYSNINLIL